MLKRARRSLAQEYTQEKQNDAVMKEVIADLSEGMEDEVVDLTAPHSQHTPESMDTFNKNLWDSVFRGNGWRIQRPIRQAPGLEATHPGGTLPGAVARPVLEMPAHLEGLYTDWSVARVGWAVLVPNWFLSESSFHTGYTPSWTQGDIIGEGVNLGTGRKMILVDLGGCDMERHMEEKDVRVARGPEVRALGSEGGMGMAGNNDNIASAPMQLWRPLEMETWMLCQDQGRGCGGLPLGEIAVWGVKRTT